MVIPRPRQHTTSVAINILEKNKIKYADYGTTFSAEWHQIFFYDPEGNIVEVHQKIEVP